MTVIVDDFTEGWFLQEPTELHKKQMDAQILIVASKYQDRTFEFEMFKEIVEHVFSNLT